MQAFLDGPFRLLFEEPEWTLNWSSAASQNLTSRISVGEVIETSANANSPAMRKLVGAYVMLADLGAEKLNMGAFQTVVDTAIETAASAIQELTDLRAKLGVVEERIAVSNERMAIQMDVLSRHIVDLEAADPYEASLRVTSLLTQMETAYALTARLQQMSLVNYL
jgi:flagellar hook-associated protein 3 FlgL